MNDMWERRDLPVLRAIVELSEENLWDPGVNANQVVTRTGLDEAAVDRSLRYLHSAQPCYINAFNAGHLFAPTERGLRAVGVWPSPDTLVDRLVAALEQIAESGESAEKRSAARRFLSALPGAGRDVLINVLGNQVPSLFGG